MKTTALRFRSRPNVSGYFFNLQLFLSGFKIFLVHTLSNSLRIYYFPLWRADSKPSGSRIRKENAADSKISGYVCTGPWSPIPPPPPSEGTGNNLTTEILKNNDITIIIFFKSATFSLGIQNFPRPHVIEFFTDLLFSTLESGFKTIRKPYPERKRCGF